VNINQVREIDRLVGKVDELQSLLVMFLINQKTSNG